ncbi:MAG: GNAT family N-acetyltransferase [Candidatus Omnitrophota bacterium]|nr:GNAT family N-acetyltransferase [Candidatus Omnitrophota bacterium]
MKIGLKLWSDNSCYIKSAARMYSGGNYDFIELYAVPRTISRYIKLWKSLDVPYIVHAPHYAHGFNLADKDKRGRNRRLFKEAQCFADELNARYIVVHCGVLGQRPEAEEQLAILGDERILIENKPVHGLKNTICVGSSPREIERYKKTANVGFCFDVNHAVGYAYSSHKERIKVINDFLRLKPEIMHIAGISYNSGANDHLCLNRSECDLGAIMETIKKNGSSIKLCTLETPKDPAKDLTDFKEDIDFFKALTGKEKSFILRTATRDDCKDLWKWRNRPEIRKNSFNDKPVPWCTHKKWFDCKMQDNNSRIYICQQGQDKAGVIRFEVRGRSVIVSVNTNPVFFNRGFGTGMVKLGTKKAFSEFGSSKPIFAEIKKENQVSRKVFLKAGYKYAGHNDKGIIYKARCPDGW